VYRLAPRKIRLAHDSKKQMLFWSMIQERLKTAVTMISFSNMLKKERNHSNVSILRHVKNVVA
jgi:hypothetical protein